MKIGTLFAPIAAAALVLSGCSVSTGSEDDGPSGDAVIPASGKVAEISQLVHDSMEGVQVGWVPVGMGIPLTENWSSQLKTGLEQLGAELIMRDPNWDNAKMPDIVDGLINEDVDVLVLHNPDVGVLTSQIQRAKDEGIYVITLNMLPSQQSDAFVGGDFQAMGAALAERVVKDCSASGKSKIATIDGFGTDGASVAARDGWTSVFKDSDLEVVSEQSANYLPAEANKISTTLLQQHPDLCAIVGNFDTMMLGASQAVAQADKKGEVGVYSIDASAPACENIKNGTLTATVSYSVPAMGGTVVSLIELLIQSGKTPGETRSAIFMPYQIIDASNVDDIALACYSNQ